MPHAHPNELLLATDADPDAIAGMLIPSHPEEDHFAVAARHLMADLIRAHRRTIRRRTSAIPQKE